LGDCTQLCLTTNLYIGFFCRVHVCFWHMRGRRTNSTNYRLPQPTRHQKDRKTTTWIWGYVLLVGTFALFFLSMYALVISKIMPPTGFPMLDAMKYDWCEHKEA
jgi:hypothetical protein